MAVQVASARLDRAGVGRACGGTAGAAASAAFDGVPAGLGAPVGSGEAGAARCRRRRAGPARPAGPGSDGAVSAASSPSAALALRRVDARHDRVRVVQRRRRRLEVERGERDRRLRRVVRDDVLLGQRRGAERLGDRRRVGRARELGQQVLRAARSGRRPGRAARRWRPLRVGAGAGAPGPARAGRPGRRRRGSGRRCRCAARCRCCIWLSRSPQVSLLVGQPNRCGDRLGHGDHDRAARDRGRRRSGRSRTRPTRSRSSQVDESGIHDVGHRSCRWPDRRRSRLTPCLPATAAAMSAGSTAVTSTATQTLSTSAPPVDHCVAAACTAGAISVAAATRQSNLAAARGLGQLTETDPRADRNDEQRHRRSGGAGSAEASVDPDGGLAQAPYSPHGMGRPARSVRLKVTQEKDTIGRHSAHTQRYTSAPVSRKSTTWYTKALLRSIAGHRAGAGRTHVGLGTSSDRASRYRDARRCA